MSAEVKWLSEAIPEGRGWALDLGGGRGAKRPLVERKGWRYVLLDRRPVNNGSQMVCGDAHTLPFPNNLFFKDALEHFLNPWVVISEVRRVLKDAGTLVIFMEEVKKHFKKIFCRKNMVKEKEVTLVPLLRAR